MLRSHKVTLVFAGLIVLFSLGAPVVLANDETGAALDKLATYIEGRLLEIETVVDFLTRTHAENTERINDLEAALDEIYTLIDEGKLIPVVTPEEGSSYQLLCSGRELHREIRFTLNYSINDNIETFDSATGEVRFLISHPFQEDLDPYSHCPQALMVEQTKPDEGVIEVYQWVSDACDPLPMETGHGWSFWRHTDTGPSHLLPQGPVLVERWQVKDRLSKTQFRSAKQVRTEEWLQQVEEACN